MSYNAVGQITTDYRQPPGPGGVFDAFGQLGDVNLAEWKISACSWQKFVGVLDKSFDGPCARRDASPVKLGEERADRWVAKQCAAGKLVYASPSYPDRHGDEERIDFYAGDEPLPQGFATAPWGRTLVPYGCPGGVTPGAEGCPPGMVALPGGGCQLEPHTIETEKMSPLVTRMAIGSVVIVGVALAGFYFLTKKR
jgi:hypothetical protein